MQRCRVAIKSKKRLEGNHRCGNHRSDTEICEQLKEQVAEKGKAPKILYQEAQEASNYCFFDNCYLKDYESISKNFPFSFSDTGKLLKSFEKYILTFNFKAITDNFEKFVFHSAPLSFIDDVLELYRNSYSSEWCSIR